MSPTMLLLITPMISLIALAMGNGLLTTLLTLRLSIEGYSVFSIGFVSSGYYIGQVIGSVMVEPFVTRVGHIRAYVTFAALMIILILMQGIIINAPFWIALRLLTGICMAGILIIVKNWFLSVANEDSKGQVLAMYMIAQYSSMSLGQFLLNLGDPSSLELFCMTAMLTSLSMIPLSMTYLDTPPLYGHTLLNVTSLFEISTIAVIGCFVSGLIVGSVYGMLPLYVLSIKYSYSDTAMVMGLVILGGILLQYPMGYLSDLWNRKKVLMGLCFALMVSSILMVLVSYFFKLFFFILCMVFGGIAFVIYPICISEGCSHMSKAAILSVTQTLFLIFGGGAALGPILAAFCFYLIGSQGYFMYIFFSSLFLFLYLWHTKINQK